MKMKWLVAFVLALILHFTSNAQQDTVMYEEATGNYIIQYVARLIYVRARDGTLRLFDKDEGLRPGDQIIEKDSIVTVRFEPATKIDPIISAHVTADNDSNRYIYSYRIENGAKAVQRLTKFVVEFGEGVEVTNHTVDGWHDQRRYKISPRTEIENKWTWRDNQGLDPGKYNENFHLASRSLPGIMNSYFRSDRDIIRYPDEGPSRQIRSEIAKLTVFPADHVQRRTVSPAAISSPFEETTFLDTLSSYTRQSRELGWITDQAIADKYSGLFSEARSQVQQNNTAGARTTLNKVLQEVERDRMGC
jgi:hypothetical protein